MKNSEKVDEQMSLIQTITTLKKRIRDRKDELLKNEIMTRYVLIDPLLRELGWDLSDPDHVVLEDNTNTGGRKVDYMMGKNMVIEAKRLGEKLDNHVAQIADYVQKTSVRYGVLTNGQKWRIYATTMMSPDVEFDLTDSIGIVLSKVMVLHRFVILSNVTSNKHTGPSEIQIKTPSVNGQTTTTAETESSHPMSSAKTPTQNPVSTAVAVWIATATLHKKYGSRSVFSPAEIAKMVIDQGLCPGSKDVTINTHISSHCVANSNPSGGNHRILYRTGEKPPFKYRLYKKGDKYNKSRERSEEVPKSLPKKHTALLTWYKTYVPS